MVLPMSELRWTLLLLGVVFILALTWWERRRPRQAFAPRLREASLSYGEAQRAVIASPVAGEPWIGDVGFSDIVLSDVPLTHDDDEDAPAEEEVIRAHVVSPAHGPLEELPMLVIPDDDEQVALRAALEEEQPEPRLIDPEASAAEDFSATDVPASEPPEEAAPPSVGSAPVPATEPEIAGAEGVGAVRVVEPPRFADAAVPEPIVEWPPEDSRRILALRVVSAHPARFSGRTLRLALAAEGFLLGKFSIFHKPDEANRALLSAASLTRPGAFDLETMDSQRYGGLSLFAVLPGSRTPRQAFEELLATARNLNERLEGALQDERGSPLTPLRVAGIRESLKAEAAPAPAASAHGA